jgi:membrane-bound metal-dependent hydrolase YbcI (DUF457 family)
MKRTTHILSGVASGVAISVMTGEDLLTLGAVAAIAGIAPDFDLLFAAVSRRIHRSPASHSLLAAVLMALAWLSALSVLMHWTGSERIDAGFILASTLAVFLSAFLHAAEDSLTLAGCALFYPLSRRRWSGPVRYDDVVANALLSSAAALVIIAGLGGGF